MGATTDFRTYKMEDRKAVRKRFEDDCEEERYLSGSGGYTGTIAEMSTIAKWKDKRFETEDEAEDYIADHHQKWDQAMAVSFKLSDGKIGWIVGGWVSE